MQRLSLFSFIVMLVFLSMSSSMLSAIDYPVISIGINAGLGQNELTKGAFGRAFLRYSLEAYIPGFQIEVGYAASFYSPMNDSVILNPDPATERRTIQDKIRDHFPTITGSFHFKPFGEMTTVYFGGGAQIHFLSASRKTTDRYWDEEAEKYQETEIDNVSLLSQSKIGYHALGGLRFALGNFGTLDVEVRQTFLKVSANDWDDKQSQRLWGEKKWDNLSVSAGVTIFIF
jgi:hypothetical protein